MKKNYINPEVSVVKVVQQSVIAVSFHTEEAKTVNDVELDTKSCAWDIWDED